jgi:hypothetical protein
VQRQRSVEDAERLQGRCRQEGLAALSWSKRFDDPIALPNGRKLITLRDAGKYITALPARQQQAQAWQTAAQMLLQAAEGRGPMMFAHVAMLKALDVDPTQTPRKKRAKKYKVVR